MEHTIDRFRLLRQSLTGTLLMDEPMSAHTSFRIGGPADFFYQPPDVDRLVKVQDICRREGIQWFVIGAGTDLLVSDAGYRGMVVDLGLGFRETVSRQNRVAAGAGTPLADLLHYATQRGLSGMENLAGIPGQVGGCIRLNAGAFGSEIGDRLQRIRLLTADGRVEERDRSSITMEYRRTDIPSDAVVLEGEFMLSDGNPKDMARIQQDVLNRRKEKQPVTVPSAGSVFKRPPGDYAGRLIEEAGCKGLRIGDAMVSKKHANFIVNVRFATAEDVLRLIEEVRERVLRRFGVALELEIELVGFEPA